MVMEVGVGEWCGVTKFVFSTDMWYSYTPEMVVGVERVEGCGWGT